MIRKAAGIEFPGWDPTTSWLIAEVEMDEEPEFGLREGGGIGPVEGGGRIRVVLTEPHLEHTSEPTLQDVSEALIVAAGTGWERWGGSCASIPAHLPCLQPVRQVKPRPRTVLNRTPSSNTVR